MNKDLRYSRDHIWLNIEDSKSIIGLTDYAQKEIGEILYVQLKSVYEDIQRGESIGSIESAKTVMDLPSPITGKIIEKNIRLEKDPKVINRDPYGEGWILKMELMESSELDSLLNEEEYREMIER